MKQLKMQGRLAGLFYLILILTGIFSHKIVRASLYFKGDAIKTADAILNDQLLFKLSITSDFIMIIGFIGLGVMLYQLFKEKGMTGAYVILLLCGIGAAMMAINMVNQFAALVVLVDYQSLGLNIEQSRGLALLFMKLHQFGYQAATISYGLWLFPIGFLGLKSRLFPKPINYLLMLGAMTYVIYFFVSFYCNTFPSDITLPADLGEFSLCIYLLIKGVNAKSI